jgi:phosphoribosylamine--glycine ligase
VGVVLASKGYPNSYLKNIKLPDFKANQKLFYMGVKQNGKNLVSDGGRVVILVGQGMSMEEAHEEVYSSLLNIEIKGFFFRTDIGKLR